MHFQRRRKLDEPEINLVAMIDVLLVLIIFLMLTTTYAKFSGQKIDLPTADAASPPPTPKSIEIGITAGGNVYIDSVALPDGQVETVANALATKASEQSDTVIIINADAMASHQSVIDAMHAAQSSGFARITFSTQNINR